MKLPKLITRNKTICGLALATLGFLTAPAANAQQSCPTSGDTEASPYFNVTGDCTINGNIIGTNGSVTLTVHGGTLTVNGTISATNGTVYLWGDNGINVQGPVTSTGGFVSGVSNGGGIIVTGTINSQQGVIFYANNDISLAGVNNATGYGDVRIFADNGGSGSNPFQIGVSGAANGASYIHDNVPGGGQNVYVSNYNSGGITYSGTNTIQVQSSAGEAGFVILNSTGGGKVVMSGTLNDNGTGTYQAGTIDVFAPEIDANGITLTTSASSSSYLDGDTNLITASLATSGTGLSLTNNGGGDGPTGTDLVINPVGSYSVANAPPDLSQPITFSGYTGSQQPLSITGTGNITLNATGNYNGVKIWGYPLTITVPKFTVNMLGSANTATFDGNDEQGPPCL